MGEMLYAVVYFLLAKQGQSSFVAAAKFWAVLQDLSGHGTPRDECQSGSGRVHGQPDILHH